MKVIAVLLVAVACASAGVIPATTLVRTPQLDSAVIQSDRIGGNFAYSSVEGHAYSAISPVVQHVATPVAVSYHATPVQVPVVQQHHIAYQAAPTIVAASPALIAGHHSVILARK